MQLILLSHSRSHVKFRCFCYVVFVCIFGINATWAQFPYVKMWDYRYGGSNFEDLNVIKTTSDGGYILGGYSLSPADGDKTQPNWSAADEDYWVVKLDANGIKQWDKRYGGTYRDKCYDIVEIPGEGYLVGGGSSSPVSGDKTEAPYDPFSNDYWVVKIDYNGNVLWDKRFGTIYDENVQSMALAPDGGFVLAGTASGIVSGDKTVAGPGGGDFWVVKIDANGVKLWDKVYGSDAWDWLGKALALPDGFIYSGAIQGSGGDVTQPSQGGFDYWIVKTDFAGSVIWNSRFGGSGNDGDDATGDLVTMDVSPDGSFYIGSNSWSGVSGDKTEPICQNVGTDFWLVKADANGVKLWDRNFGGSDMEDEYSGLVATQDGGCVIMGPSYSPASCEKSEDNIGIEEIWASKTDAAGNTLWDKVIFNGGHNEDGNLIETADGCLVFGVSTASALGYKTQPSQGFDDYWLVKFCTTMIPIADNDTICQGDTSNVLAYGDVSYWWSTLANPTVSIDDDSLLMVTPTITTTYIVHGSTASDTISVTVNLAPSLFLGNDTSLCTGQVLLDATILDGMYVWQDNTTNPTFNVATTGTYSVTVTNASGCSTADTINVSIVAAGSIDLGNDTSLCDGQTLTLDAALPNATFSWNNGATTASLDVTTPGVYAVTVTANGCSASDSIDVSYSAAPAIFLGNDTSLCDGQNITIGNVVGGASYVWNSGATTSTVVADTTGFYAVTVTLNGCSLSDSIDISFVGSNNVNLGNDTTVCSGQSITLDATTSSSTYVWQDGTTDSTLVATATGLYSVTVTSATGCSATDSISVTVLDATSVNLGNDTTLCGPLVLNATTANASYLWQDNTTNPLLNVATSGTYAVTVSVAGCSASDSIHVTINPVSVINLGNDTSVCEGQLVALSVDNSFDAYLWSNGETTASISVAETGAYAVTVSDGSCSASDTVTVNVVNSTPFELGPDTVLCSGSLLTLSDADATGPYLWSTGATAASLSVYSPGVYWLQAGPSGCTFSDTIEVVGATSPGGNLGSDTIVCRGDTVTFDAGNSGSAYQWSTGDTAQQITVGVFSDVTVWVAVSKGGCTGTDSVTVSAKTCQGGGESCLFVPNAFSPNDDGINDVFQTIHCPLVTYRLVLYNRWGEKVFESYDPDDTWDGVYKRIPAPLGVYVYYIEAVETNGRRLTRKGNITLMR